MASEHHDILNAKLVELIDILLEAFADEGDSEAIAQGLERYALQVGEIAQVAEAGAMSGLHNVGLLYQEAVGQLIARAAVPSEQDRVALEEWPMRVMAYLEAPTDAASGHALIEHLQTLPWTEPVANLGEELLIEMLAQAPAAVDVEVQAEDEHRPAPIAAPDFEQPVGEEAVAPTDAPTISNETPTPVVVAAAAAEQEPAVASLEMDGMEAEHVDGTIDAPALEELPAIEAAPVLEWEEAGADTQTLEPADVLQLRVAELVNILLEFPEQADTDPAALAAGLERYASQVEVIGSVAESSELLGLFNICVLYREVLDGLLQRGTGVSVAERALLEEWPTHVMGYLTAPADPDAQGALIMHLQDPIWKMAIPQEDAELLVELLARQAAPLAESAEQTLVGAEPVAEDMPMAAAPEPIVVEPTHDLEAATAPVWEEAPAPVADDRQAMAYGDPVNAVATPTLDEDEVGTHGIEPALVTEAVAEDEDSGAALAQAQEDDVLDQNAEVEPAAAELAGVDFTDTEAVEAELSETEPLADAEFVEAAVDEPELSDAELTEAAGEMDNATKEMVDILRLEVAQLGESLGESLQAANADDWRQALEAHAEEMERLGEGAEAVGLMGLQMVCGMIRANVLAFSQGAQLGAAQRKLLGDWPATVVNYLQAPDVRDARTALVNYLQDARWPQPLASEEGKALADALVIGQLDIGQEDQPQRPRHAQLEDISLALPDDVNPELLDSLLQELPNQTAEFSTSIQRLVSGNGTLADVDVAKRVAHTLKGAANTVGIRGIANLTHHIEDILVAFSKHQTLPTAVLNQTLTHAADTLEAMSEALAGISDAPPERQTLALMQEVLDWANLIDRQGIPGDAERPKVRDALPGLKAAEPAVEEQTAEEHHAAAAQPAMAEAGGQKAAAATTPSAAARVSADLVDELLRLAGEAMILNRQLQDRLVRTQNQLKSIHSHNSNIQQMVLELEQLVDVRGISSPMLRHLGAGGFDPLEMEQYNELHTVSRRLLEAVTDTREMNREVDSHLTLLDGLLNDQRRVQRENEETVMRTRMVPVKTIAARLQRSVRQACRLTGKEAELVLNGGETLMDSEVLNSLVDPLMHLLRNAVDHGIERPEERAIIGKPRSGSIVLDFWREGNSIVVRCKDDGAGLNYAAIRYAAIERGLLRENQRVSEEELARLIMMPGFSTRSEATQVSGRGIGMDAVYTRVQELKGSLNIRSEANKGSQFDLKLPVTLLSTHGLLVRVQKRLFAVSDRSVEQILYSGSGSLGRVGNKTTYQIGDDIYEATALDNLLGLGDPQDDEHRLRPALLVREESGRNRVVFVDEVIDSLDLVVKNMGRYIPTIRGIMGATILGDGSATAVLDLPELLAGGKMRARGGAALKEAAPAAAVSRAPLALVVDDSLTARRVLADFVKDLGYEVRTASDGLEAVAILEQRTPNILLVDMEMPRMNGLELTSHVRSNAQTKHLPVIMITSRSTEKHRQSAEQAGVNAYLVKPFSEDELAKRIQELQSLKGAA